MPTYSCDQYRLCGGTPATDNPFGPGEAVDCCEGVTPTFEIAVVIDSTSVAVDSGVLNFRIRCTSTCCADLSIPYPGDSVWTFPYLVGATGISGITISQLNASITVMADDTYSSAMGVPIINLNGDNYFQLAPLDDYLNTINILAMQSDNVLNDIAYMTIPVFTITACGLTRSVPVVPDYTFDMGILIDPQLQLAKGMICNAVKSYVYDNPGGNPTQSWPPNLSALEPFCPFDPGDYNALDYWYFERPYVYQQFGSVGNIGDYVAIRAIPKWGANAGPFTEDMPVSMPPKYMIVHVVDNGGGSDIVCSECDNEPPLIPAYIPPTVMDPNNDNYCGDIGEVILTPSNQWSTDNYNIISLASGTVLPTNGCTDSPSGAPNCHWFTFIATDIWMRFDMGVNAPGGYEVVVDLYSNPVCPLVGDFVYCQKVPYEDTIYLYNLSIGAKYFIRIHDNAGFAFDNAFFLTYLDAPMIIATYLAVGTHFESPSGALLTCYDEVVIPPIDINDLDVIPQVEFAKTLICDAVQQYYPANGNTFPDDFTDLSLYLPFVGYQVTYWEFFVDPTEQQNLLYNVGTYMAVRCVPRWSTDLITIGASTPPQYLIIHIVDGGGGPVFECSECAVPYAIPAYTPPVAFLPVTNSYCGQIDEVILTPSNDWSVDAYDISDFTDDLIPTTSCAIFPLYVPAPAHHWFTFVATDIWMRFGMGLDSPNSYTVTADLFTSAVCPLVGDLVYCQNVPYGDTIYLYDLIIGNTYYLRISDPFQTQFGSGFFLTYLDAPVILESPLSVVNGNFDANGNLLTCYDDGMVVDINDLDIDPQVELAKTLICDAVQQYHDAETSLPTTFTDLSPYLPFAGYQVTYWEFFIDPADRVYSGVNPGTYVAVRCIPRWSTDPVGIGISRPPQYLIVHVADNGGGPSFICTECNNIAPAIPPCIYFDVDPADSDTYYPNSLVLTPSNRWNYDSHDIQNAADSTSGLDTESCNSVQEIAHGKEIWYTFTATDIWMRFDLCMNGSPQLVVLDLYKRNIGAPTSSDFLYCQNNTAGDTFYLYDLVIDDIYYIRLSSDDPYTELFGKYWIAYLDAPMILTRQLTISNGNFDANGNLVECHDAAEIINDINDIIDVDEQIEYAQELICEAVKDFYLINDAFPTTFNNLSTYLPFAGNTITYWNFFVDPTEQVDSGLIPGTYMSVRCVPEWDPMTVVGVARPPQYMIIHVVTLNGVPSFRCSNCNNVPADIPSYINPPAVGSPLPDTYCPNSIVLTPSDVWDNSFIGNLAFSSNYSGLATEGCAFTPNPTPSEIWYQFTATDIWMRFKLGFDSVTLPLPSLITLDLYEDNGVCPLGTDFIACSFANYIDTLYLWNLVIGNSYYIRITDSYDNLMNGHSWYQYLDSPMILTTPLTIADGHFDANGNLIDCYLDPP